MRPHPSLLATFAVVACATGIAAVPAVAQEPTRAISEIAGDVYRFQNNFHFSMFVVTTDGIVVTDPINAEAATWLEGEIASRFGDLPIAYMIYSHHHADHISGGEVFADTATVIAHENAAAAIEADGVPTALPDISFSDAMTLQIGGKTFEMTYVGPGHSDNMIVTIVRPENVGFVVDIAAPTRLPFRDFGSADIDGWIAGLMRAEALDFEIMAPGHGNIGSRGDIEATRVYMESLRDQVQERIDAGMSDDEIAAEVTMDDYANWSNYEDWRELNVRGMTRYLRRD